jgi:transglutaminase-like putative cysteine protease
MLYHPAFGEQVRYAYTLTSDDPAEQVADTIALMRRYVLEDSASPLLIAESVRAVAGAASQPDAARNIFHYVRRLIRFVTDEHTLAGIPQVPQSVPLIEALIRPVDMARMCASGSCRRSGDCDDFAMFTAALLRAAGIPSSFVTVAADPGDPSRFSHVYVAAYPDGERLPLDASHGEYPGWEVVFGKRQEWPIDGLGVMGNGGGNHFAAAAALGLALLLLARRRPSRKST